MKARFSLFCLLATLALVVIRLVLMAVVLSLPLLLVLGMLVAPAYAQAGTLPAIPNILNMTLTDFLGWIVSDAVLGAVVALLLIRFNVPEVARPILLTAALGAASWLVRTLLPFVPPEILSKTVWEVVFILLGMIPAWLGLRLAALQYVGMMRRAQATVSSQHLRALKLAGLG